MEAKPSQGDGVGGGRRDKAIDAWGKVLKAFNVIWA